MKCTLTDTKQQKINSLEASNKKLEAQLQNLLATSQKLTNSLKSTNTSLINLQTQVEVQKIKNSILNPSISALLSQLSTTEATKTSTISQQQQLEHKNKELSSKLYQLNKEKKEALDEMDRLKKELKLYDNIKNGNCNIVKVCDGMKKENQTLMRTLAIFSNKLESHRRYLGILKKKEEKEEKMRENEPINKIKSTTHIGSNKKIAKYCLNDQKQGKDSDKKQIDRKKIKEYNELTRKKNQLLMMKSTGKI